MFVGLNDIAEEGVYVWTDGTPNVYARFISQQPDNHVNDEDCIVMSSAERGGFADIPCSYKRSFFCETTIVNL